MLPFHERLARIGLEALESHGLVLAGGYAISVNGIGDRPSARSVRAKCPESFEAYEVGEAWRLSIVEHFLDWADEIDPAVVR